LGIRLGTNKAFVLKPMLKCQTVAAGLSHGISVSVPFSSHNAIESTTLSSATSFVVRLSMPANVEVPSSGGATSCWWGSNYWKKTRCTSASACSQALWSPARSASPARAISASTACTFSGDMSPRLTSAAAMEPGVG
jgi:hypothetical protein